MEMRVERIIHPAGFGAFCTERFFDGHIFFNMVYDCGSTSKEYGNVVMNDFYGYFSGKGIIDLLCISHFDEDHINVLRQILQDPNYVVKGKTTILLPYIAKKYGLFKKYDETLVNYDLICKKIDELGIKKILVRPYTGEERPREGQEPQSINPEGETQMIDSGTGLCPSCNIPFWIYVPLFLYDSKVYDDVIAALKTTDDTQALTQSQIDHIEKGYLDQDILAKFKKVCKKHGLSGTGTNTANMNSMMLLSTPLPINQPLASNIDTGACACHIFSQCQCDCRCFCCRERRCYKHVDKASCLYTGDISLQAQITKDIVRAYKPVYFPEGVGLLQIPHHGALGCYDLKTIKQIDCENAFVNTDLLANNIHRPVFYSQMVIDFNNMKKCLFLVLKDRDTMLVQEIRI